ncbi:MAG: hypothetical protein VBE63_26055, partial [Lamprobacter sp.]|uniref:hypothetical protein n=1 Tax=Lamprobacter sp. TaxID=3100796 RepID=UPI002B260F40
MQHRSQKFLLFLANSVIELSSLKKYKSYLVILFSLRQAKPGRGGRTPNELSNRKPLIMTRRVQVPKR